MRINASVGRQGKNQSEDVRTIQEALNSVPVIDGGPQPRLSVDGMCGPKTTKAIQSFQLKHFGWSGADGRVDPEGATHQKLRSFVRRERPAAFTGQDVLSPPLDLPPDANRLLRVGRLLNQAQRCIKGAQSNLIMAINAVDRPESQGPFSVFSRSERMKLVNRHFDVDLFPAPMRKGILSRLLRTFDTMATVFQRPGGLWGRHAFDIDRHDTGHVAYAYRAGFFRPGQSQVEKGKRVRLDAIYFGKKYDTIPDEEGAIVIVHELAHFVGHPYHIDDHAYGWYDRPKMKALTPNLKLTNAMSFNNFAWNTLHDRPPNGVKSGA